MNRFPKLVLVLLILALIPQALTTAQTPTKPSAVIPTNPIALRDELARLRRENDSLRAALDSLRRALTPPVQPPSSAVTVSIPDRPSESHPGKVSTEYDRFKDQTVVTLEDLTLQNGLKLTAFYFTPGAKPSLPSAVSFMLTSSSKDWQYLRCNNVDLLADGKAIEVQASRHDGRVGSGYVLEFVTFSLPLNSFFTMGAATEVDGRLCRTEFRFRAPELTAFRDFASRMK